MEAKSLKAIWIEEIEKRGNAISIKELASILDCSYAKIREAIASGYIPGAVKKGPENTRCDIAIPKWGAIRYVQSFPEEEPKQRLLFPELF